MTADPRLTRRRFLAGAAMAAGVAALATTIRVRRTGEHAMTNQASSRMPVLFVGHGSPMNAIEDNRWSRAFQDLAAHLPRPRAVLAISAHWYTDGSFVTAEPQPRTIHDFGGFPQALFDQRYPAPGDPALARKVAGLLGREAAALRTDWGLDHGTWTVLKYLLPKADVPVVQLSVDRSASGAALVDLGRRLAGLRDEGVLLLGSGNVTHNLGDAFGRMRSGDTARVPWAEGFDADIAQAVAAHDTAFLAKAHESDLGRRCHPTPDHYLPLLHVVGAATTEDAVAFPVTGFDAGSLSMRTVRIG